MRMDLGEKLASMDKILYIISVLVENPDLIVDVGVEDPYEKKSVFDSENPNKKLSLSIEFKDDGLIRGSLITHVDEMERMMQQQLEMIRKEKSKYE